jgi:hypothetical protein
VFPRFSRKKAKEDALMLVEKSIATELRTFTNHLQTVTGAFEIVAKQNEEIIKLLKELNKKK